MNPNSRRVTPWLLLLLMSSFTDESSGEARKIEAQAKLKEAEGALFRAETKRMTQTEQLSISS